MLILGPFSSSYFKNPHIVSEAISASIVRWVTSHFSPFGVTNFSVRISSFRLTQLIRLFIWWWKQSQLAKRCVFRLKGRKTPDNVYRFNDTFVRRRLDEVSVVGCVSWLRIGAFHIAYKSSFFSRPIIRVLSLSQTLCLVCVCVCVCVCVRACVRERERERERDRDSIVHILWDFSFCSTLFCLLTGLCFWVINYRCVVIHTSVRLVLTVPCSVYSSIVRISLYFYVCYIPRVFRINILILSFHCGHFFRKWASVACTYRTKSIVISTFSWDHLLHSKWPL
jgi:hypothetical protein